MNLETKLLNITAHSRFRLMKKIWHYSPFYRTPRILKDEITNELRLLRDEIFKTVSSSKISTENPLCRKIVENEEIPNVNKNIYLLAINGIDAGCIADLNCVNVGYVRACLGSFKEDYPELFR